MIAIDTLSLGWWFTAAECAVPALVEAISLPVTGTVTPGCTAVVVSGSSGAGTGGICLGSECPVALLVQAAGMSAATTIDDVLVLVVFFGRVNGNRVAIARIVLGEYLGFGAILAISVIGALGAAQLPQAAIPYLGLVPLLLGLRAGWLAWRQHDGDDDAAAADVGKARGLGVLQVALISFANGGDNIGVYVPVFAVVGMRATIGYVVVLLLGVAVWCAIGWYCVSRPAMARALSRWGHLLLPVVLIGIGLGILIEGGAFGL